MADEVLALPARPDLCAEVDVGTGDDRVRVFLRGLRRFAARALSAEPNAHADPTSTVLVPRLIEGEGDVLWLLGHRMSTRHHPGDTLVVCSLLLELPDGGFGPVRALWYEDHYEVPHSFSAGTGRLERGEQDGAAYLELDLVDEEYGDRVSVQGLVRGV